MRFAVGCPAPRIMNGQLPVAGGIPRKPRMHHMPKNKTPANTLHVIVVVDVSAHKSTPCRSHALYFHWHNLSLRVCEFCWHGTARCQKLHQIPRPQAGKPKPNGMSYTNMSRRFQYGQQPYEDSYHVPQKTIQQSPNHLPTSYGCYEGPFL